MNTMGSSGISVITFGINRRVPADHPNATPGVAGGARLDDSADSFKRQTASVPNVPKIA